VAVLADDDGSGPGNAEWARHGDDRLRHLDVGARGGRIAGHWRAAILPFATSISYFWYGELVCRHSEKLLRGRYDGSFDSDQIAVTLGACELGLLCRDIFY
jgi:hypothetical protein